MDKKVKEMEEKWGIEFLRWNNYGDHRLYVARAAYFAACLKRQEEINDLLSLLSEKEKTIIAQKEWSSDQVIRLEKKIEELETKLRVKFIIGRADQMVYDAELVDDYRKRAEQAEAQIKELGEQLTYIKRKYDILG
jgi:hypothetical protein